MRITVLSGLIALLTCACGTLQGRLSAGPTVNDEGHVGARVALDFGFGFADYDAKHADVVVMSEFRTGVGGEDRAGEFGIVSGVDVTSTSRNGVGIRVGPRGGAVVRDGGAHTVLGGSAALQYTHARGSDGSSTIAADVTCEYEGVSSDPEASDTSAHWVCAFQAVWQGVHEIKRGSSRFDCPLLILCI